MMKTVEDIGKKLWEKPEVSALKISETYGGGIKGEYESYAGIIS